MTVLKVQCFQCFCKTNIFKGKCIRYTYMLMYACVNTVKYINIYLCVFFKNNKKSATQQVVCQCTKLCLYNKNSLSTMTSDNPSLFTFCNESAVHYYCW